MSTTPIEQALATTGGSSNSPQLSRIVALCISLNPNDDKRTKEAIENIYAMGFGHVDIAPGVKGNNIPENDVKKLLSTRAYDELKNGRYVHEGLSSKGAIGCYLAHVQCWSRIASGADGREVAVFEDDFVLDKGALEGFKRGYMDASNRSYDILRLSHRRNPDLGEDVRSETDDLVKVKRTESAVAYMLTVDGAKKLMALAFPIEMQVDHFIDTAALKGDMRHYGLRKSVYRDANKGSQIGHNSIKMYRDGFNKNTIRRHSTCLVIFLILAMFTLYTLTIRRRR